MRPLEHFDQSSIHSSRASKKKKGISLEATLDVMQYQDSGAKEDPQGQHQIHQQQQQQQRAYLQETRQPQHRGLYPQQPQQPSHPPANAQLPPSAYAAGLNPYSQRVPPDVNMTASAQHMMEHEYMQQRHHQQYMQQQSHQHQHSHRNPYGAAGGYPPPHVQQQHQGMPYQQIPQQYNMGPTGVYPPHIDPATGSVHSQMSHQYQLHPQHAQQVMMQQQQELQHHHQQPQQQVPYLQPRAGRLPADRPLIKLSMSLIDTYKHINTIYYEERDAKRAVRAKEKGKTKSTSSSSSSSAHQQQSKSGQSQGGTSAGGEGSSKKTNNGWDDENYDYIITPGELFYGRYRIKERIGKGSFGQVVRAEDTQEQREVAIKIIKSKKPFLMQAKTEIELLTHLNEKDENQDNNIVRLLTHFMHRNHQCLVFEMLSLNLYELLKNTQFGGVSLNLIRKFAKQVLKSLTFLARKDVDVIHCDLKPENILLRHPKKSGIKVIDFGSSCRSNKRMYSYIQSRFYRSPEVMLGLPYSVSIDMWSLGCILAEMHTGEPLFSGSDQFDQMQKIVKILGMVPSEILDKVNDQHRLQFFERVQNPLTGREEWCIKQVNTSSSSRGGGSGTSKQQSSDSASGVVVVPSQNPIASLSEIVQADTNRKKKYPQSETGNSPRNYELFVDLISRMLAFDPLHRIKPDEALLHPFIAEQTK